MTAQAYLQKAAAAWRALGEEYTTETDPARLMYVLIELVLLELAEALEHERTAA